MIAVVLVPQGITKSFVNFSSKNCYILTTFFVFGRIVEEHIVFEWFSSVKQKHQNAFISAFWCFVVSLYLSPYHPHGDRTRNSGLRGRRLNQFDQRAQIHLLSYRMISGLSNIIKIFAT